MKSNRVPKEIPQDAVERESPTVKPLLLPPSSEVDNGAQQKREGSGRRSTDRETGQSLENHGPGDQSGKSTQQEQHPVLPPISRRTKIIIVVVIVIVVVGAILGGFLPRHYRNKRIREQAEQKRETAPTVAVVKVQRSKPADSLALPGTITALVDTPIFARASGYVKTRRVDIGDRVRRGQLLAVIDAPDLDQQVDQARATLRQSESQVGQVQAQLNLARVTRDRFQVLANKGVVARQDFDTQEANFEVSQANLQAAQNVVKANAANLDRLAKLQGYERVISPYDGIVTARNIDTGSLISATGSGQGPTANAGTASSPTTGGTQGGEMFRVAQVGRLRVFINVPEAYVPYARVGNTAEIQTESLLQGKVNGKITRTANSVDPNTRTLLTEIQVDNSKGTLLPGMYAVVSLVNVRGEPPLAVPSDSIVTRANGSAVAVVKDDQIHLQPVVLGRDYGPMVEVVSGLNDGDMIVLTPNDSTTDGAKVQAKVSQPQNPGQPGQGGQNAGGQQGAQQSTTSNGQYQQSPASQPVQPSGNQQGGSGKESKPPGKKK